MSVVAAFGEVLWDLLPDGPVLGGAPFNFVYRMSRLGHDGVMISAVGRDDMGRRALDDIERLGMRTDYVQRVAALPTGTVKIEFDDGGEPQYEIVQNVAYDHITYHEKLDDLAHRVDCVCFGTLALRNEVSRRTLTSFLDAADADRKPLKLLDVNLRKDCYRRETVASSLARADIVKMNGEEVLAISRMFGMDPADEVAAARAVIDAWDLQHIIVTLGPHGAFCVSSDESMFYDPGHAVATVDPCGSGDAFAAAFLHELLIGHSAADGVRLGNVYGAAVAEHRGATQPTNDHRIENLQHGPPQRQIYDDLRHLLSRQTNSSTWTT